ncbi:sensor histidine kinase [Terriglobus roseus]|uniref:histidine kinase n=1 Tax=Terriglobus roseus TaxID=392734 RepID=A0A1G7H0H8_9BACT|nr:ATP-binding protein [Terriglobus roseus]SDE93930.1 Signal transduction histidine kinase [Terriglobus roseus]
MRWLPSNLRTRLTFWYVGVLAVLLLVYAAIVFAFQYAVLTKQIVHDEIQDVVTAEGLLYFDYAGTLQLRQDYYSRPQSRLLVDRLMEVRDSSGRVLYRSPTLGNMSLGGPVRAGEGDVDFNERLVRLADGTHVLLISHIHGMNGQQLLIRLAYSMAPLRARMIQFLVVLLIAIPVALLIAGAAGQAIAKRALRPVEEMAMRAEGITAKNLHDRLEVVNPEDELGQLALVFNHLLDRLEQSFEQLQRFTADAAHELRTPIAALRTIGEVALQDESGDEVCKEALSSILEETSRLSETVDALLLLARAETTQGGQEPEAWPLQSLVDEVLNLLEVLIEEKGLLVVQDGEAIGRRSVRADRGLLRIALMNVIHNAVKFSPRDGSLRIGYALCDTDSQAIQVAVEDSGPGIANGEHKRVFDRFFTSSTRDTIAHTGTGLGLSVSKLVIERIGGTIHFDSAAEVGARCVICLPEASSSE